MSPRQLFRALAVAEAVTWTLLLIGMVGKHALGVTELGVRIGGGVHGFVFLAYCAGTGGSILIIGSAAGVAVMGSQRISFGWYLRKFSGPALLGYAAGAATYLGVYSLFGNK